MGFLPLVKPPKTGSRTIYGFKGLNLSQNVMEGELSDCKNIMPSQLPSLSVRGQMKMIKQVESPYNLTVRAFRMSDAICAVVTDFQNAADCNIYTFSGSSHHFAMGVNVASALNTDFSAVQYKNYVMVPYYDSENSRICMHVMCPSPYYHGIVVIANDVQKNPKHIHMAAFNNRLLCAYGESINICYEDDFFVWNKFYVDGSEQGNYDPNEAVCQQIPLSTGGNFTACTYFKDKPIIFKERAMYALYGSYTPFSIVKIADVGCVSNHSIQVVGDELIFLSENGLMSYSGGTPTLISQNIPGLQYEDVRGCCATNRYYFINQYVYDLKNRCFSCLDERYTPLCAYRDRVFFFDYSSKQVLEMLDIHEENGEVVEWSFTTGIFHEALAERKRYSKLRLRAQPVGKAKIRVEYSIDGGTFTPALEKEISNSLGEVISLNLPPCHSFQLKVKGTGRVTIPFIGREFYSLYSKT